MKIDAAKMKNRDERTKPAFMVSFLTVPVIWSGPLLAKAIDRFWGDTEWGELDYLIGDRVNAREG